MPVIHENEGELDIRAFTTFGLHAKPNSSSPIGKFGTGLKYGISTLVRTGHKVQVFIGETEYEFYTKPGEFRGVDFSQVMMRKKNSLMKRWSYTELPFTTEHGKFWEVWQAFRELYSNTLDEGGDTRFIPGKLDDKTIIPKPGRTLVVVTGDKYEAAFHDKDKTFLPGGLTQRDGDSSVQVFNEPSDHLYWRGIRVFDLEKPSIYTYNILEDLTLTEDRTLKYLWDVQSKLAAYVARSKDRKMIASVVSANQEKHFEGRLDFDYAYTSPSTEFLEVLGKKRGRGGYVAPRALAYYDKYAPRVTEERSETLMEKIERLAYDDTQTEEAKHTFKYLLRCEITEPPASGPQDDEIPF